MTKQKVFFRKKRLVSLLVVLITLTVISCKKNVVSNPNLQQADEMEINSATKFIVNGTTEMTMEEFIQQYGQGDNEAVASKFDTATNTSVVIDADGQNYIFTSDQNLRNWAMATDSRISYINKLDSAEMWQQYADNHGMLDDSLATVIFTDSIIAAENAANGNNVGAPPFFTGLYNGYNYSGTFYGLPFVSLRPTFGSFNNKASSLADFYLLPKLNMLAAKTWFRGSKFFYWSWRQIPTLGSYNFDNKTCSKL